MTYTANLQVPATHIPENVPNLQPTKIPKGGNGKTSKCRSSRIPKPKLNKNPAEQLTRSQPRFRFSGAGNTLPVSIPRNAVAQLKMADNHGRTTGGN